MRCSANVYFQYPTGTYVIPMIASSYTLAAAVCSLMVTMVGMPLGRRNCILLGNLLVIIGASLQASSWSVAQIIVARIICVSYLGCCITVKLANSISGFWHWGMIVHILLSLWNMILTLVLSSSLVQFQPIRPK